MDTALCRAYTANPKVHLRDELVPTYKKLDFLFVMHLIHSAA